MQLLEFLFLIVTAVAVVRIIVGPKYAWLTYSRITLVGLVLATACLAIQGLRWQLLPAGIGFILVVLGSLKRSDTKLVWRVLGALPVIVLAGSSALLAQLMPIVSLPTPTGSYGVGTFDFSITDSSRIERYAPERKRELFVEVWYPADKNSLDKYPVQTLFHDLYRGAYNRTSLILGYTKHINTHSHINAPVATAGKKAFPVLLFNHAGDFGFTSQNTVLMEHLASNGYVVFSIAHPYQTAKVNLAKAGTILRASGNPSDIDPPRANLSPGIIGTVFNATKDILKVSEIKKLLYPLSEKYVALTEKDKAVFLKRAVNSAEFEPFKQFVTEERLLDFIDYDYIKDGSLVQYWVEDNQFIANSLPNLHPPIAGFVDALDLDRMGVIGMSYGGAAAGEFCKIDRRCKAGANLDGTQWGRHWDSKLPVPFLMLYNDQHQGGNDYAYLPPAADFWDYRIKNTAHTDFTDFAYLWPILRHVGFSGKIEGMRMMEILNTVQLNFFDHYLKGKAIPGELYTDIPEIVVRHHAKGSQ